MSVSTSEGGRHARRAWPRLVAAGLAAATAATAAILALSSALASGAHDPEGPIIHPTNLGGGVLTGLITITEPAEGIPGFNEPCANPTKFTFSGGSPKDPTDPDPTDPRKLSSVFILNTVGTGYFGPVTITASGVGCANGESDDGTIEVTATGRGPTGSELDCPGPPTVTDPDPDPLEGPYSRRLTHISVSASGNCLINRNDRVFTGVNFEAEGEVFPSDAQGNPQVSDEPLKHAVFNGVFTVTTSPFDPLG